LLTPKANPTVAYSDAVFSADDKEIYFTSDEGREFQHLVRMHLADRSKQTISRGNWDVEDFSLSDARRKIAYATNENGVGVLHIIDVNGKELLRPSVPQGVLSNLKWHPNEQLLAFNVTSAKSPNDVYSVDMASGKLQRWTESETG